jgi:hypothetical protein
LQQLIPAVVVRFDSALSTFSKVLFNPEAVWEYGVKKDWTCSKPVQDFLDHLASEIASVIVIDNEMNSESKENLAEKEVQYYFRCSQSSRLYDRVFGQVVIDHKKKLGSLNFSSLKWTNKIQLYSIKRSFKNNSILNYPFERKNLCLEGSVTLHDIILYIRIECWPPIE